MERGGEEEKQELKVGSICSVEGYRLEKYEYLDMCDSFRGKHFRFEMWLF